MFSSSFSIKNLSIGCVYCGQLKMSIAEMVNFPKCLSLLNYLLRILFLLVSDSFVFVFTFDFRAKEFSPLKKQMRFQTNAKVTWIECNRSILDSLMENPNNWLKYISMKFKIECWFYSTRCWFALNAKG